MTRSSSIVRKHGSDRGDYGFARARDIAFDAVLALWRKRKAAGVKQSDIAAALGRDPAWVSKQLKGPGNWTLRTIGELVEAMDRFNALPQTGFADGLLLRRRIWQKRSFSLTGFGFTPIERVRRQIIFWIRGLHPPCLFACCGFLKFFRMCGNPPHLSTGQPVIKPGRASAL